MNGEPTQALIGELEFWESTTSRWRGISIESLEAAGSVRKFLTRQEYIEQGDQLQAEFEAEQTPEEKAEAEEFEEASSRLLKALGLIPASADLRDQADQLTDDFVGGFFSPDTRELNVVLDGAEGRFGPADILTYVHEFVHLMQDVEYGLFDILDELESDDEYVALQSLFEGEAEWVSQLALWQAKGIDYLLAAYEVEEPVDVEAGAGNGGSGEVVEVSEYLLGSFAFPYLHGQAFLSEAFTPITPHLSALQDGTLTPEQADENFAAWSQRLDELYERPPSTTEQVLHYDKYLANEPAIDVTIATAQEITDAGWTAMWRSDWGEGGLRTWLESAAAASGSEGDAFFDAAWIDNAVSGWGGDELVAMRSSCGDFASVALIEWDDPVDDPWEFTAALLKFLLRDERFASDSSVADAWATILQAPAGFLGVTGGPNDEQVIVVTADDPGIVDHLVGWALGEEPLLDPCGAL